MTNNTNTRNEKLAGELSGQVDEMRDAIRALERLINRAHGAGLISVDPGLTIAFQKMKEAFGTVEFLVESEITSFQIEAELSAENCEE